tara:strand:+ start:1232 stop:1864 length:633 start_codon:yes stop_codon:yes gene_type:complete
MSKITFAFFLLLFLTSCATSKFDFATAYKFQTVKRYTSLGEKNLKVLASPEQVFPNPLAMSESEIIETASLKSISITSEDIIHSKLSTYEGLDNMFKQDIKRNNKLHKIITRLSDIKFDTIVTESGLVVPLIEKEETQKETPEERKKSYWTIASAMTLFIPSVGLIISPILAFVGYKRGERGSKVLLIINAVVWALLLLLVILISGLYRV